MTKLEYLKNLINEMGILIDNYHFSKSKKAMAYHETHNTVEYKAILLDKPNIESNLEEMLLLAEETGHFATNALYIIEATINFGTAKSNRIKYESKAKKWAAQFVLSSKEIQEAIDCGCKYNYEVAEYHNVNVESVNKAVELYKQKGVAFGSPLDD